MLGYSVTSAICLFFLVMIPIWSERGSQPHYPFAMILFLGVIAVLVPMLLRRRRREGAADPGALEVTVENPAEVDVAKGRRG